MPASPTPPGRRVATILNDTVIQELASVSFTLAALAERVAHGAPGHPDLAADLGTVGATLRHSIGTLRALIVDLHPPALAAAGLEAALNDAASPLRLRGVQVDVEVQFDAAPLEAATELRLYAALTAALAELAAPAATPAAVRIRVACARTPAGPS